MGGFSEWIWTLFEFRHLYWKWTIRLPCTWFTIIVHKVHLFVYKVVQYKTLIWHIKYTCMYSMIQHSFSLWYLGAGMDPDLMHVMYSQADDTSLYVLLILRPLSLYCLVDEVLRRGKIMPDEKKNLTFCFYFIFSSDMTKKPRFFSENLLIFTRKSNFPTFFFIFSSDQRQHVKCYFYFFSSDNAQKTPVGARRPNNIVSVA